LSVSSPASSSARASASKPVRARSKPSILQGGQFDPQHRVIPAGVLGDAVVRDHQGATLRGRQVIEHDDRHDVQPEFLGSGQTTMPSHDDAVAACKDRIGETELGDRRRDLRHLIIGVRARVAGIGHQLGGRPLFDLVGQPRNSCCHLLLHARRPPASKDWPVASQRHRHARDVLLEAFDGDIHILGRDLGAPAPAPRAFCGQQRRAEPQKGSNTMSPASV
jgi:hypothetical protein